LNEFFALGSSRGYATENDFWPAVFQRVFILNPKAVLLRRFYLFLPIVALIQSYFFIRDKKHTWLVFWFVGLSLLFIGFTSSLTHYQPIIQRLSWYMFPLFLPAVLLSTFFIMKFNKYIKIALVIMYLTGSIIMTHHYTEYFNIKKLDNLKTFLRTNDDKIIFTDHFTKYSVDLIDNYQQPLRTKKIYGSDFDLNDIRKGDWILYKSEHINELREQGHTFPDFSELKTENYKVQFESGGFVIYEKILNQN
jgi:hypothetical protein